MKLKKADNVNNIFNNYFNIFNSDLQNVNFGEKESLALSKDFSALKTNYLNSFRASSSISRLVNNNADNASSNNLDNFSQDSKKEKYDKTACCKYHKKIIQEKDDFIKLLLSERTKLHQTVTIS